MQRKPTLLWEHPSLVGTTPSLWRLSLWLGLSLALLWVVHPLFAGQRGNSLSGNQVADLKRQGLSRRQLQALYIILLQYVTDYEGRLPALDSPDKLRKQLKEYRITVATLNCPFTNMQYLSNKNLAGKKLDAISKPAGTLLFWSPKALPDGHYLVLDASGLDRRITAAEFAKMKRSSGIK